MRTAVLIDERDRRVGKLPVTDSCFVIRHNGAFFVRTQTGVRLHHSHRALAVVFQQTEVYVRDKVEPA